MKINLDKVIFLHTIFGHSIVFYLLTVFNEYSAHNSKLLQSDNIHHGLMSILCNITHLRKSRNKHPFIRGS